MSPEIVKDQKAAVVIGCEGYVGEHLLKLLSKHAAYRIIYAIVSTKNKIDLPKVKTFVSSIEYIRFEKLDANDLFICYDASFFNSGGKYVIPEDQYRFIPKMISRAYKSQIGQVMLLSNKRTSSDALLYVNRSRGLIEDLVVKMGFWSTHVFKPSLLIGESLNQRWGQGLADKIGNKIDSVTGGWLKKNKPIEAEIVAKAMLKAAQKLESGVHFYSSEWLQDFASSDAEGKDLVK
ncbi:MAG: hypothetical protein IPL46_18205 [Saprospiraceae bacterium]|nr:hypothetical protein [Saprospiraceae bacterium]